MRGGTGNAVQWNTLVAGMGVHKVGSTVAVAVAVGEVVAEKDSEEAEHEFEAGVGTDQGVEGYWTQFASVVGVVP